MAGAFSTTKTGRRKYILPLETVQNANFSFLLQFSLPWAEQKLIFLWKKEGGQWWLLVPKFVHWRAEDLASLLWSWNQSNIFNRVFVFLKKHATPIPVSETWQGSSQSLTAEKDAYFRQCLKYRSWFPQFSSLSKTSNNTSTFQAQRQRHLFNEVRLPSVSRQDYWDRASPCYTCRIIYPQAKSIILFSLYTKSHSSPEKYFWFPSALIPNKISHTDAQINKSEQCGVLKAEHRFIYNQVLMGSWINKNFAPYTLIPLCRKCLNERLGWREPVRAVPSTQPLQRTHFHSKTLSGKKKIKCK